MSHNIPPEPWHSFLTDVDALVPGEVHLYCFGGFVMQQLYELPRPTSDVDTLPISPNDQIGFLLENAGRGSELHKKHKIHLDIVTVCTYPENYKDRLTELFPGVYQNLRIHALEVHDLALAKIERNSPRDREDIKFLAKKVPLDLRTLKDRYEKELRPYLANPPREDLTIKLWIEMIEEDKAKNS
ncbi:MAG TPA: DUF6036 family nucleotidyltransferase [Terriglobales bacterium]|jgi:hypothetical protein